MGPADEPSTRDRAWIATQWEAARTLAHESDGGVILALDEIHKTPQWSETVERLLRVQPSAQLAIGRPRVERKSSRMAGLPRAEAAIVEDSKLYGYLLSADHPAGSSKARFFDGLGFTPANALVLQAGLLQIARIGLVVDRKQTEHGTKFVIDGELVGPAGRRALIRTIWLRVGYGPPRLVTAYPSGAL